MLSASIGLGYVWSKTHKWDLVLEEVETEMRQGTVTRLLPRETSVLGTHVREDVGTFRQVGRRSALLTRRGTGASGVAVLFLRPHGRWASRWNNCTAPAYVLH